MCKMSSYIFIIVNNQIVIKNTFETSLRPGCLFWNKSVHFVNRFHKESPRQPDALCFLGARPQRRVPGGLSHSPGLVPTDARPQVPQVWGVCFILFYCFFLLVDHRNTSDRQSRSLFTYFTNNLTLGLLFSLFCWYSLNVLSIVMIILRYFTQLSGLLLFHGALINSGNDTHLLVLPLDWDRQWEARERLQALLLFTVPSMHLSPTEIQSSWLIVYCTFYLLF